jgi:hypothetical protein
MSIAGIEDSWMLLGRQSEDGYPLVVRARVKNDFIIDFETTNDVLAVICYLKPSLVQENGMPTDLNELIVLEDELIAALACLEPGCFHTASVTGDGRRVLYFAHCRGDTPSSIIANVKSDIADIEMISDFDRATYREFITPTQLDTQLDGDQQVISALEQNGDQAYIPRKIDFWFYGEPLKLQLLVANLTNLGFEIDHWLNDPSGVMLSRTMETQISRFHDLTPQLLELAEASGVEYDGWETFAATLGNSSPHHVPPAKPRSFLNKLFGAKKN